jgi:hypothetical protein
MARNEQKLTIFSPLSELAKPGALKQNALPGLPLPHDDSPLSRARLAFILRRGVESVQMIVTAAGRRWGVRTEHKNVGFSSSLFWRKVGDEVEVTEVNTLRGKHVKLSQDGDTAVVTNEHGATIRYRGSGAGSGVPTLPRRALEQAQQETPWYLQTHEQVGRSGVRLENIEAEIIDAPAGATVTKNDKPVVRFKLRILGTSEPVELPADVYNDKSRDRGSNPYRIQQTLNKKLKPGEKVIFTGHYHIDRTTFQNQTSVKPYERKWLRLLVIERKPTG